MRDVQTNMSSAGAGLYTISLYSAIAYLHKAWSMVVYEYMKDFISICLLVLIFVCGFFLGGMLMMQACERNAIKAGVGEYNSTTGDFQYKSLPQ